MLKKIKDFFGKKGEENWGAKPVSAKGYDAARQIKEMAKLGGRLIL